MRIDTGSHVPVYLQIANGIREAVAAGIYRPGESLPSLRAMAIEATVNPNTVQRAYDELAREGLIFARRGKGLFVAKQGATSARTRAEKEVKATFEQGVRAARAAGMTAEQVRALFEASIDELAEVEE